MQTYTFGQCSTLLDIDPKVFRDLVRKELGLQKGDQVSRADRRARYLTREQLERLAARLGITLPGDDALRKPEHVPVTSYKLLLDRLEATEEALHAGERMISSLQEEFTQVQERLTQVERYVEQLTPTQEQPDHRLAELEAQHRQQLAEVEARYQRQIDELEAQLARYRPDKRPPSTSLTTTKKKSTSKARRLPKTLASRRAFAALHHIPDSVVARACNSGKIAVVNGRWLYQSRVIFQALGERGQHDFYQLFHTRSDFIRCKQCPHAITQR
jgi:DNA repair exonuclease SbcCD ATPase subunit